MHVSGHSANREEGLKAPCYLLNGRGYRKLAACLCMELIVCLKQKRPIQCVALVLLNNNSAILSFKFYQLE